MAKRAIAPGKYGYSVGRTYRASLKTVWDAATQAKHINKYFTDGAKGDIIAPNKPVMWAWKGFGSAELHITSVKKFEHVEFHWDTGESNYDIIVRFDFTREKGRTVLRISERGWKEPDIKMAFGYCQGWTEFVTYLKAYLLYGVDFRKWPTTIKR
jgi:uncharacterized protein YndB with AHSA1/START domain